MPNFFYEVNFYLFGLIAIASSIAFVTRKSPVAAVLWLVNTMFCLAALYVMLEAHFVGVIQVLVYAGAIMVVFLFVVMLLNLGHPSEIADMRGKWGRLAAGLLGLALSGAGRGARRASGFRNRSCRAPATTPRPSVISARSVVSRSHSSTDYLLAFELTSILLLVAIVGAVVIGRRRKIDAR